MKIVIFSHSSGKYGAELALFEMVEVLKKHHECIVIVPQNGPLIEEFKKINIDVKILKYKWWVHDNNYPKLKLFLRFLLNILYSILAAYKIKKYKPDLIITSTLVINTGVISSFLLKCPHIWIVTEFLKEDHRLTFDIGEKIAMKIVNNYSNSVIVVSNILKEKWKKFIKADKLKLIYLQNIKKPLQNEKASWPIISDKNYLKLVIIGSIQESKGQILAIEALNILKKSGIEKIQLLIIGTSGEKYLNKLHNKVSEYNLKNQISFLGYINNPYPIILATDSLLMLSDFESFGRVTIMGMFCGKTIIASNSGSASELIKDGENGLLYKLGSSSDLALKINYIYNNRKIIKEIGEKAKIFSNKFHNPKKYYDELNILINESIINKK